MIHDAHLGHGLEESAQVYGGAFERVRLILAQAPPHFKKFSYNGLNGILP
jgi:hypothetical protein